MSKEIRKHTIRITISLGGDLNVIPVTLEYILHEGQKGLREAHGEVIVPEERRTIEVMGLKYMGLPLPIELLSPHHIDWITEDILNGE